MASHESKVMVPPLVMITTTVVVVAVLLLTGGFSIITGGGNYRVEAASTWCVARSAASDLALQTGLDYACSAGADCAPIQSSGLCFLPNTFQAHASYAFNSYYQRSFNAPGSCDFSATATVATTDPSYGSCVYPSSASTAGGTVTPGLTAPPSPPGTNTPIYGGGVTPGLGGGSTPGLGPVDPTGTSSKASGEYSIRTTFITTVYFCISLSFILELL